MKEPIGPTAQAQIKAAREELEKRARLPNAAHAANIAIDAVNDACNALSAQYKLTMADSLMARALAIRGILAVASAWWSEAMPGTPVHISHHALMSIVDEPPLNVETVEWKDEDR